jgi:hypothetical protein
MKLMDAQPWTLTLKDSVGNFLKGLRVGEKFGPFLPCKEGVTEAGRNVRLGFSALVLKTYYTLGLWDGLSEREKKDWISYIQSFQANDQNPYGQGAFVDAVQVDALTSRMPWYKRFYEYMPFGKLTTVERLIIAETKQAIATLEQVGARPVNPYRGFPATPDEMMRFLSRLDWSKPWSAGGQASAMAAFLQTEGPFFLAPVQVKGLKGVLSRFLESRVDAGTGAYFKGKIPEQGQLVNGAMKVLTALDWLGQPIHYPERLIDMCLRELPPPEGCHLVDWVYVLYRSSCQTPYRIGDIQDQSKVILEMIRRHHNPDGGFSSRVGKSKSHYYGVRVTEGLPGSDVVGTALLTWAIAMVFRILDERRTWKVIKP